MKTVRKPFIAYANYCVKCNHEEWAHDEKGCVYEGCKCRCKGVAVGEDR